MAKKVSFAEKLRKRREDLNKKGGGYNFYIIPEGTMRVRVLPFDEEESDFAFEAVTFFIGKETIISAETFGEACPFMEAYKDLSKSDDPDEVEFADKKLKPKRAWFTPVLKFEDSDGKELKDEPKLLKMANTVYAQMIDFFLEPEQGDFTNPLEGYDLKIKRTGKGMQDTEYTVIPCKVSRIADKKYRKTHSAETMLKALVLPFEDAEKKLNDYIKTPVGDSDKDDKPKKKKSTGDLGSDSGSRTKSSIKKKKKKL